MDWLQLVTIISIMAMPAQTWPLLNLCFFVFKGVLISINSLWTCNRLLDNSIFLKNKDDISSLKCQLEDQSQLLRSLSDHFQEGYIWPLHWPPSIFTTFNVSSQLQTSCRLHFREEAVVGTASVYEEKRGCDKSPTSLCSHQPTKNLFVLKSHTRQMEKEEEASHPLLVQNRLESTALSLKCRWTNLIFFITVKDEDCYCNTITMHCNIRMHRNATIHQCKDAKPCTCKITWKSQPRNTISFSLMLCQNYIIP